jgi:hypothetical protein
MILIYDENKDKEKMSYINLIMKRKAEVVINITDGVVVEKNRYHENLDKVFDKLRSK